MEPIDRLRELLIVAESGALAELGGWITPRLRDYLENARHGVSLDQALGLAVGPGETPWYTTEALAKRDAAILALAKRLPI